VRCAEARRSFIAAAQGVVIARGAHLVGMLNAFEANGTVYAVMEREAGTDVAQLALLGPLSAGQLFAIAEGILGALERLHRAGVIHGDVKPANLRIGPEQRAVLVDFGVAALPRGGDPGAALRIGPNPYAPMELCYEDPELRGPWTDVYGLAGAFYTVVTGRTPPPALDRGHAVLQGAPDPLQPAGWLPVPIPRRSSSTPASISSPSRPAGRLCGGHLDSETRRPKPGATGCHVGLREARDWAAVYGAHPPGWDRSGALYGRAPHRDRKRSGQRPLAVLGRREPGLAAPRQGIPGRWIFIFMTIGPRRRAGAVAGGGMVGRRRASAGGPGGPR
jgi:serine/threonine protein kinase